MTSIEAQRRQAEEEFVDPIWPFLLAAAYDNYERQGRGAVFIKMTERDVDWLSEPLYVVLDDAVRQFAKPGFGEELGTYDPRSELVLVFGYPESVWIRKRFAINPLTGERLRIDSLARAV